MRAIDDYAAWRVVVRSLRRVDPYLDVEEIDRFEPIQDEAEWGVADPPSDGRGHRRDRNCRGRAGLSPGRVPRRSGGVHLQPDDQDEQGLVTRSGSSG